MKYFLFIVLYLMTCPLWASPFIGDYELLSGPKTCPVGNIDFKNNRMMFGSSHVWMLGEKEQGEAKEVVEGGCTYLTKYEKSVTIIKISTLRSFCADAHENGQVIEILSLKKDLLTYDFSFVSGLLSKSHFYCEYKRSVAK